MHLKFSLSHLYVVDFFFVFNIRLIIFDEQKNQDYINK